MQLMTRLRGGVDVSADASTPAGVEAVAAQRTERKHRRDTLTTTLWGLGTYALALVTSPLLARALEANGRGTLAAVLRPTEIIGWLLMFGIPLSTAYMAIDHDRRKLQASSWVFSIIVGVPIVAVLWPLVPAFLKNHPPEAVTLFRACLVAALVILPFQNVYEYLRATGHLTRFNIYRSAPIALNAIAVTVLFFMDHLTLTSAVVASLVSNAVVPLAVIVIERGLIVRFDKWFSWAVMKGQLHYGVRVWFGTLSNMVVARFDQLLMVRLVSATDLGLYVIAATGAMVTAPVAQGVSFALFPYIRSEVDPEKRWRRTGQALRWVLLTSIVASIGLALIAPWGLPFVMGPEFKGAVTVFLLLLPGQMFWNMAEVMKVELEAANRPGVASAALAVAAGLTVVSVPFAVKIAGIAGAAAVTSSCQVVFFGITFWQARKGRRQARVDWANGPGGDVQREGFDGFVGLEG